MGVTLQLALLAGALVGLGVALLTALALPAHPQLRDAMGRLSARRLPASSAALRPPTSRAPGYGQSSLLLASADRIGPWVQRRVPASLLARVPTRDLELLQMSSARYWGEKGVYAGVGLVLPSLVIGSLSLLGIRFPVAIPVLATLAAAAVLPVLHDVDLRARARTARQGFTRALGAYVDLVALERRAGTGATQAMESAAASADTWVFARIRETLARARWAGDTPWRGLHDLADTLDLPDLHDVADIAQISGESGSSAGANLRAKSASLRSAALAEDQARAKAHSERLVFPIAVLTMTFMALIVTPALLTIFTTAPPALPGAG